MRASISHAESFMSRYFIWRLIVLFLFAGFIQAKEVRQSLSLDPVPQLEPGKAKLVDLASLPLPLRRVIEEDVIRLRAHHDVLDKEMPADEAQELDTLAQRLLPLNDVAGKTKTPLADVSASVLAGYVLEGVLPDGPARESPWSSLRRVFRRPDGVLVMLNEWDYVADGGGVLGVRELMNAVVGPYPAQLAVRRGPAAWAPR
jgi:hypothetical protein